MSSILTLSINAKNSSSKCFSNSNHSLLHLNSQTHLSSLNDPIFSTLSSFCSELKNNFVNLCCNLSLPHHLSFQNLVCDPSPIFHSTISSNHKSTCPPHTFFMILHQIDSLGVEPPSHIPCQPKYVESNTLFQISPQLWKIFHLLAKEMSLTPNLPSSLGQQIFSHPTQDIFLSHPQNPTKTSLNPYQFPGNSF